MNVFYYFLGKWIPGVDPLLVGHKDYVTFQNFRYGPGGRPQGVAGFTKANTTGLPSTTGPIISPNGGTGLTSPQPVTITVGLVGGTIYYTTDGTKPDSSDNKYSAAFDVTVDNTVVKAVVYETGGGISAVTTSNPFIFRRDFFITADGEILVEADGKYFMVIGV